MVDAQNTKKARFLGDALQCVLKGSNVGRLNLREAYARMATGFGADEGFYRSAVGCVRTFETDI
jgi:hypothetical protein